MHLSKKIVMLLLCFFVSKSELFSQNILNNPKSNHGNKFEQLGTILNTPNEYRTASGAPGHKYWQQQVSYEIDCELDEVNQILSGNETITYVNNSPDGLSYLWIQLDENEHRPESDNNSFNQSKFDSNVTDVSIYKNWNLKEKLKGLGVQVLYVKDSLDRDLNYVINQTMMRVDLPKALKKGRVFKLKIKWKYKMPDRLYLNSSRGGYEYFAEDKNYLFTVSQWYPRLCVYNDFQGWQNKQFTGRGEFALSFGDFKVTIKVPYDHIVGSTGECINYEKVLSKTQLSRWKLSQTSKQPIEIITLSEAIENSKNNFSDKKKSWVFVAKNVRDFAWTSSRRFIWDAMRVNNNNKSTMCMSYYCKEAYPLYRKYSTKIIAHTIKSYSKYTIDYPYPVAISVEASNGMEYPMISFNYGRTNSDGTYSQATKYGMISVIIHEVGHNFFPMIINSDERQWSWMDEGLNTFVQYLTEQTFSDRYPSKRGPAYTITDYMKLPKDQLEPIMTNSENIIYFGSNAYAKPAAALNILRETIMGRELFDFAFKQYANRWAFKHPTPADFFRTMEDASGVDLDWFWRAWFYDIDPVDISLDSVKIYTLDLKPVTLPESKVKLDTIRKPFLDITKIRNRQDTSIKFLVEEDSDLVDFYETYQPWNTEDSIQTSTIKQFEDTLTEQEKINIAKDKYFYELYLSNKGGTVMPLILEWQYTDGTKEIERIAAEIWRKDEKKITKVFVKNKQIKSIQLDPLKETADINESNNVWPQAVFLSKFQIFKNKDKTRNSSNDLELNPMQKELLKNKK